MSFLRSLCSLAALLLCALRCSTANDRPLPLPAEIQERVVVMEKEVESAFAKAPRGMERAVLMRELTASEGEEIRRLSPSDCPVGVWGLVVLEIKYRGENGSARFGRVIAPRYCDVDLVKVNHPMTQEAYRKAIEGESVKKAAAEDLVEFFEDNYRRQDYLPMDWIIPYHYFMETAPQLGVSPDELSMRCNNSYSFAPRRVRDTGLWSRHTFGAIDLNPFYNPAIVPTKVGKAEGLDLSEAGPEALTLGLVQIEPSTSSGFAFNRTSRRTGYLLAPSSAAVRFFSKRGWTWGGNFVNVRDYQHFGIAE